jgi:hypothetical protein
MAAGGYLLTATLLRPACMAHAGTCDTGIHPGDVSRCQVPMASLAIAWCGCQQPLLFTACSTAGTTAQLRAHQSAACVCHELRDVIE